MIAITSAFAKLIVPLSIVACVDTASVSLLLSVFVLDVPTVLFNVTNALILWAAKFAPKSIVKVVLAPFNANVAPPSWLLPDKLNTSPAAPVPPEPVLVIDTV